MKHTANIPEGQEKGLMSRIGLFFIRHAMLVVAVSAALFVGITFFGIPAAPDSSSLVYTSTEYEKRNNTGWKGRERESKPADR